MSLDRKVTSAIASAVFLAACGSAPPIEEHDAGIDASHSTDAGLDAQIATDAGLDAQAPAEDAGPDARADAGSIAPSDSGCAPHAIDAGTTSTGPVVLRAEWSAPALVAVSASGAPFRRLTPILGTWNTEVTSGPYTLVWVCQYGSFVRVSVLHALAEEGMLVDGTCAPQREGAPVMLRGVVNGRTAGRDAFVVGGSPSGLTTMVDADGSYGLSIGGGTWDIAVDERDPITMRSLRMQVVRAVEVGATATLDFDLASAGYDIEEWPVAIDAAPGEELAMVTHLHTSGGGLFLLEVGGVGPPSNRFRTMPAAGLAAGEMHRFGASTSAPRAGGRVSRTVSHYSRAGVALDFTLLPVLDTIAIDTITSTPSLRTRTTFDPALGAVYQFFLSRSDRNVFSYATRAWVESSCAPGVYDTPALESIPGWMSAWSPTGTPAAWGFTAFECVGSSFECATEAMGHFVWREGFEMRATQIEGTLP